MTAEFEGAVFGQYELLEQLDDNGIIHSYRAVQQSLGRPVAVHIVSPAYRQDAHWRQALMRGAEIAARHEHPNIVPIIDCGLQQSANGPIDYVALRLMEGGSLRERLANGPLPVPEVVAVVRQIGAALDYVHSRGVCHGDPATVNIIFDLSGSAYIADFYLMGFLQATQSESPVGVPAFMAPERFLGEPPTPLSDQFALAGVAYMMLTGKGPRDDPDRTHLLEAIAVPATIRPEISSDVTAVLARALAHQTEDRFPTILEFARQFEEALKSKPQPLFISYSRRDSEYGHRLNDHLRQNGLPVWMDNQIEHGDQWFNDIHEAIKRCAAFLVVMSPEAEQSEWVQKEILLAKRYKKPIFPLLLDGQEFALLIDIQYADVRGETLPGTDFYRRVSRSVYGR